MTIEIPKYKVLSKEANFELREYESYKICEIELESSFDDANHLGFEKLHQYISGYNTMKIKIDMTSPVMTEFLPDKDIQDMNFTPNQIIEVTDLHRVSFMLPFKYKNFQVPKPLNDRVKIKKVPTHLASVINFNGNLDLKKIKQKFEELNSWIFIKTLKIKSHVIVAQYSSPIIPGFLKKNEIMVRVEHL